MTTTTKKIDRKRKVLAYAAGLTACGASTAYGDIIAFNNLPTGITNSSTSFNVIGGSDADIRLGVATAGYATTGGTLQFRIIPQPDSLFAGITSAGQWKSGGTGASVSGSATTNSATYTVAGGINATGNFFFGIRTAAPGGNLGWLRISRSNTTQSWQLISGAIATAGESLSFGQTMAPAAIPEPSSAVLGLMTLAMGATGVRRLRKSRAKSQDSEATGSSE